MRKFGLVLGLLLVGMFAGMLSVAPSIQKAHAFTALDGHAFVHTTGLTATITFSTAQTNDVVVAIIYSEHAVGGIYATVLTVTDTSSLTWTKRGGGQSTLLGVDRNMETWYAISAATQTNDVITVTYTAVSTYSNIEVLSVSGANTATPFDSNGGLPAISSTNAPASVSTSNANDFIFGMISADDGDGGTNLGAGTGFTLLDSANYNAQEYKIVSATQSGLSMAFTSVASYALSMADAIQAASSTVTQPIEIVTANSAPSATISISGCGASNSTFTANGNVHTYTGMTASCTVTLTQNAAASGTVYEWNISPHPSPSSTVTFLTCASGTCSEYENTTYYQLRQYQNAFPNIHGFEPKPLPAGATWDGSYSTTLTGTYLGVPNYNVCLSGTIPTTQGGGAYQMCTADEEDYGQPVTVGSPIGNTWFASPTGSNVFTPTTAHNTYIANFLQNLGVCAPAVQQPFPTWLGLLMAPLFLVLAIAVKKKRRR